MSATCEKPLPASIKAPFSLSSNYSKYPFTETSTYRLKSYFEKVINGQKKNNFIKFPSLFALAGFFKLSEKEIIGALNELRQSGFDYEIVKARETILVWNTHLFSS